jgi:hypothetical protein
LQTKTKDRTLNPIWDEQFDFLVSGEDCYITIDVWDADSLSQDDFMGRCMLALPLFREPALRSFPLRRSAAADAVEGELQMRIDVQPEYFHQTRTFSPCTFCLSAFLSFPSLSSLLIDISSLWDYFNASIRKI